MFLLLPKYLHLIIELLIHYHFLFYHFTIQWYRNHQFKSLKSHHSLLRFHLIKHLHFINWKFLFKFFICCFTFNPQNFLSFYYRLIFKQSFQGLGYFVNLFKWSLQLVNPLFLPSFLLFILLHLLHQFFHKKFLTPKFFQVNLTISIIFNFILSHPLIFLIFLSNLVKWNEFNHFASFVKKIYHHY